MADAPFSHRKNADATGWRRKYENFTVLPRLVRLQVPPNQSPVLWQLTCSNKAHGR